MSGNVVSLSGEASCFVDGRPDPAVVAKLEELLAAAQSGEIVGLAYVVVKARPGDPLGPGYGTGWTGGNGTIMAMGAGVLTLTARYGGRLASDD